MLSSQCIEILNQELSMIIMNNEVISNEFSSHLGVRQGECLSPF